MFQRSLVPYVMRPPTFGGQSYASKILTIQAANALSLLNLAETSGGTAADATGSGRTGAYNACTLNATTFTDGTPAPSFDGSTSFVNWFTSSLQSALSYQEGTFACWLKASAAGIWTDALFHAPFDAYNSGTHRNFVGKNATNNTFLQITVAGGTGTTSNGNTVTAPGTTWHSLVSTWSHAGSRTRLYFDGTLQGNVGVGPGVQSASPTTIYAGRDNFSEGVNAWWSGNLKYCGLWSIEWTQADVTKYNTVP